MKKSFGLLLVCTLILCWGVAANAQSKVIRKTVRKVVTPQITPIAPPKVEATPEVAPIVLPPPPPTFEVKKPEEYKGLFGWGLNTDLGVKVLAGSILVGARGDIIFADPLLLGEKIGLAQDAFEYKLGLGLVASDKLKSIPLLAEVVIYLKEGSLFGLDPYVGAGLNFNLYGTGRVTGGVGGQFYLGILADFGLESKTGLSLGYGTHQVGDSLTDSGIFMAVSQPIKL